MSKDTPEVGCVVPGDVAVIGLGHVLIWVFFFSFSPRERGT